jgi:hypothetical protein
VSDQPGKVPDVDRGEVSEIPDKVPAVERGEVPEIPDDGSRDRGHAPDPDEPSPPGDRPVGAGPHSATIGELLEGESLDDMVAREREH